MLPMHCTLMNAQKTKPSPLVQFDTNTVTVTHVDHTDQNVLCRFCHDFPRENQRWYALYTDECTEDKNHELVQFDTKAVKVSFFFCVPPYVGDRF